MRFLVKFQVFDHDKLNCPSAALMLVASNFASHLPALTSHLLIFSRRTQRGEEVTLCFFPEHSGILWNWITSGHLYCIHWVSLGSVRASKMTTYWSQRDLVNGKSDLWERYSKRLAVQNSSAYKACLWLPIFWQDDQWPYLRKKHMYSKLSKTDGPPSTFFGGRW